MLKYPTFSASEFDCIAPSLYVVDWWLALDELEAQLRAAEKDRDALLRRQRCSLESAVRRLQDVAAEAQPKFGDSLCRKDIVSDRLQRIRRTLDGPRGSLEARMVEGEVLKDLKLLYGSFDAEALESDLEACVAEAGEVPVSESEIAAAHGRIGAVTAKINQHWLTVLDCFADGAAPRSWKAHRLSAEQATDPVKARQVAEDVVRSFIRLWRERSQWFNEPVSIGGTSIESMPRSRRAVWDVAFKKLGFDRLPKTPYFEATKSNEPPEPEPEKEARSMFRLPFGVSL